MAAARRSIYRRRDETTTRFRISLRDETRGPYEIATDDVQESQRRLKRCFRIVLENFPEILYAGERGGTCGRACLIFIIRVGVQVSTFIIRAVDSLVRAEQR